MLMSVVFGFVAAVVTFVAVYTIASIFKIPHAEKIDAVRLVPALVAFIMMLFFTWAVKDPTWMWSYIITSYTPYFIWWCRKVAPKSFF